jgi:hypothetical protein
MTLFHDGNLVETTVRVLALAPFGAAKTNERRDIKVVACPQCAARFASSQDIEREWMQKHMERSHGPGRIARLGQSRFRRAEQPGARKAS